MIKKIKKICIALALVFVCLLSCFPFGALKVHANGIQVDGGYTGVLDDLRKAESFDEMQYPIVENDYTLQVIQIAESVDKELFVYVYQPNEEYGKYVASTINISATLHNALAIKNYGLSLINYDGVFQKYLVTGLTLPTGTTRYYDVVSIYRVFDESIDEGLDDDNGNTINEVVFKVAKQYTISDTEDGTVMRVADTDVVEVTDKFVGFVRYSGGFSLAPQSCDSHFVAFSTDKEIDKLYEADVFYTTQSYESVTAVGVGFQPSYGDEIIPHYAYINHTEGISYNGGGWGSDTYLRDRIQTTADFIEDEKYENVYECGVFNIRAKTELTETAKANIANKQWILRFVETDYVNSPMANNYVSSTIVGNVSILRLKFETDGVVYNLGVVDNKQSGSRNPVNETEYELELNDTFKMIMAVLLVILLFVVLGPVLPIVFKIIGFILKLVLKIITAPFRFIGWLFRKR